MLDRETLVVGTMRLLEAPETSEPAGLTRFIAECEELGLRTFDVADIYGRYRLEEALGTALRALPGAAARLRFIGKAGCVPRFAELPGQRVSYYDTRKQHLIEAAERSLERLGIESFTVFLVHRADPLMEADEVAAALAHLQESGKAAAVGVSNFSVTQFELLQARLDRPLVTNQVEFSLARPGALFDGVFDLCQRRRIRPMIWSPIGGGAVLGSQARAELSERLHAIAAEQRVESGAVALAWALHHPTRPIPVLGSTRIERLRALQAASDVRLTRHAWFELLELARGRSIP